MIDKQPFANGMGLLAGTFNRSLDAAVVRAYYGILSPKLTTEEFQWAIEQVMTHEKFWPSPVVILGYVQLPEGADGAAALERVNRVLRAHGGHRFLSHETFHREFDAPTRAAISAVDGLAEITGCTIERYPSLKKKFIAAYSAALNPVKCIAEPDTDPRVKALVSSVIAGRDRATRELGEAAD